MTGRYEEPAAPRHEAAWQPPTHAGQAEPQPSAGPEQSGPHPTPNANQPEQAPGGETPSSRNLCTACRRRLAHTMRSVSRSAPRDHNGPEAQRSSFAPWVCCSTRNR